MTARAIHPASTRSRTRTLLLPSFAVVAAIVLAAGAFVSYLLQPTWTSAPTTLSAPEVPITVAGVLFDVPPLAIRAAVQRQPGPHERIDLAFLWPTLTPPAANANDADQPAGRSGEDRAEPSTEPRQRLFVTIAALGTLLPPAERLRGIYPRYVEGEATAGPDGLAILPFRDGTPYDGEDLIYLIGNPEQFFARCSRQAGVVPGICIHERAIGGAEITLRFPRQWLDDWRGAAAGFDRLVGQLHPQAEDSRRPTENR